MALIYASYVGIGVPEVVERIELADDALVTGLKLATGLLVVISDDDGARVVVVLVVAMVLEGVIVPSGINIDEVVELKHGHVVTVTISVAVTVAVTLYLMLTCAVALATRPQIKRDRISPEEMNEQ